MFKFFLRFCAPAALLAAATTGALADAWKPEGDKIKTVWAEQVNPANPLPEYPRPQLARPVWKNLNGLWDYAIAPKGRAEPKNFDGKILVPFPIESSLSGVQKTVNDANELWYKREFTIPADWKGRNVILNFGAVDWRADVFVNDALVGSHQGGYTPFSFDITASLQDRDTHKLVVRVWDPTERGFQPRGKQDSRPWAIWYTSVTGIWQTVWLEPVSPNHITQIKTIPDVDASALDITVGTALLDANLTLATKPAKIGGPGTPAASDTITVQLLDAVGHTIAEASGAQGEKIRLPVKNPVLWSPENPHLYDLRVLLRSASGATLDEAKSYAALRKISVKRDATGFLRMQLNDTNIFQLGLLDQGYWPDGIYTAPTDDALAFDIRKTKEWGFNTIRKHVKVEPARWYYHCDRLGVLVWQDMPSTKHESGQYLAGHGGAGKNGSDTPRTPESAANFYREWGEIMNLLISSPSVVIWVPFNEAWGQFDTEKVAEWTAAQDPSRLVDAASGGNYRKGGHLYDIHRYAALAPEPFETERVNVIGEFGGTGMRWDGHTWSPKKGWGYVQAPSTERVNAKYLEYSKQLKALVPKGVSGAIYTQTTDVEIEVNGLITYDRKKVKIDETAIRRANREVIAELK